MVQGRSDLFLKLEIIKKIIALAPLFIGAFVGIFPMLYTSIITSIIAYFLNSYYSGKILGYTSWMQIKDIAPSFSISIIMAVVVYLFKYLPCSNWFILPIQIIVGSCVFILISKTTKIEEYNELMKMLSLITNKLNKVI